jgi:hypothetical protein
VYGSYSLLSDVYLISNLFNAEVFKQLGSIVHNGECIATALETGKSIYGHIVNGDMASTLSITALVLSSAHSVLDDPFTVFSSVINVSNVIPLFGLGIKLSIPWIRGWMRSNNPEVEGSRANLKLNKAALLAKKEAPFKLKNKGQRRGSLQETSTNFSEL